MKPFNLEAALAGAPVITREGVPVTQITNFQIDIVYPIIGVLNNKLASFTREGRQWTARVNNEDLFMAPIKQSYWINMYFYTNDIAAFTGETMYNSEAEAVAGVLKYTETTAKQICIELEV